MLLPRKTALFVYLRLRHHALRKIAEEDGGSELQRHDSNVVTVFLTGDVAHYDVCERGQCSFGLDLGHVSLLRHRLDDRRLPDDV